MAGIRGRRRRPHQVSTQMVSDAVVLAAASAVIVALTRSPRVVAVFPLPLTDQVTAVAVAVAATGAAVLGALAARLVGDLRSRWIVAAVVLYSFVVLPLTAFVVVPDETVQRGARLLAYLVAVGMLAVAVRPPPRVGAVGTWSLVVLGAALAAAGLGVPGVARAVGTGPYALVLISVVGAGATAALLIQGYRRISLQRWRVGLGLMAIVGAQLFRVGTPVGDPTAALTADGLRLLGVLTVVAGLGQLSGRAMNEMASERSAQQEELVIAMVHMERAAEQAAERDHELRNGLAGLAGITHLLSLTEADDQSRQLRRAALGELARLNTILTPGHAGADGDRDGDPDGDADGDADAETGSGGADVVYPVEPVLADLVVLRRSAGHTVTADLDSDLKARGDPSVLAQIVVNLFANCARHAPGASIALRTYSDGDDAVVEIRDRGPGLPPDVEPAALERGVHDAGAGGSGLGLYLSAELARREGGSLRVRTVTGPRGCLATITLPRP